MASLNLNPSPVTSVTPATPTPVVTPVVTPVTTPPETTTTTTTTTVKTTTSKPINPWYIVAGVAVSAVATLLFFFH